MTRGFRAQFAVIRYLDMTILAVSYVFVNIDSAMNALIRGATSSRYRVPLNTP